MLSVRQRFPASPPVDIAGVIAGQFGKVRPRIKPGANIAVAVGSRGITNLHAIVGAVLENVRRAGAKPFIVPAMGSHGGASAEGQKAILAEYGITEAGLQVPIKASMEVEGLGRTEEGVEALFSAEALHSDGVILINRVKPHTDFRSDSLGSGLLKMLVIGLGKRAGAANYHLAAARLGYEAVMRAIARVTLGAAPVLGGVAIVENQSHETAQLAVLLADEFEVREAELFRESKRLMPKLPFDDIDLLIVDRLGKNISGAGMDPNITGRWVHGYSSMLSQRNADGPTVRRLFVRELTPETHGNAIGLGLADFTTTRLVRGIDHQATYINALTSLSPNTAKIPIHFETDREVIGRALDSICAANPLEAKVVRIGDTLSLEELQISEGYSPLLPKLDALERIGEPEEMQFDPSGNLQPL